MEHTAISLKQYNQMVGAVLRNEALMNRWVTADLSDVSVRGGHCYLELIDKNPDTDQIQAKARGIIWSNTFSAIKYKFKTETGQNFQSGIKVMIRVSTNFHEQFGFSLIISDINPSFTLGDMERKRREILNRLASEGIIDDNKKLSMPLVPQRIAIISAPEAAGYGDFMNQLKNNTDGIVFYTVLFQARMQGKETASSVIAALERIALHASMFDCVVIIRGGGATSDLNSFDDYNLAANVAQFPLPIITGIGHERDNTVLDYISNLRVKTPTAAAEWLVAQAHNIINQLNTLSQNIIYNANEIIFGAKEQLSYINSSLPHIVENKLVKSKSELQQFAIRIPGLALASIQTSRNSLNHYTQLLRQASEQKLKLETMRLDRLSDNIKMLSPVNTLKRGYSITTYNGKAVTSADDIPVNAELCTSFANGKITSIVKSKN